jgi:hypothetical protein
MRLILKSQLQTIETFLLTMLASSTICFGSRLGKECTVSMQDQEEKLQKRQKQLVTTTLMMEKHFWKRLLLDKKLKSYAAKQST